MATSTTNLGLIKPAGTDKIRIAQINGNMDIIDEKVGAVGNTSLQTQVTGLGVNLTGLEDCVGIVVDGAKSAVAASAGQYIVLKNSIISGCDDGLYTAAQAIPADTTIDSTYLTAVSGGGLNALNTQITTDENFLGALIRSQIVQSEVYVLHFYYSVPNGTYLVLGQDPSDASILFVTTANSTGDLQCGSQTKWKVGSTLTAIYLNGYSVN